LRNVPSVFGHGYSEEVEDNLFSDVHLNQQFLMDGFQEGDLEQVQEVASKHENENEDVHVEVLV
jgi:hypothetical protein